MAIYISIVLFPIAFVFTDNNVVELQPQFGRTLETKIEAWHKLSLLLDCG